MKYLTSIASITKLFSSNNKENPSRANNEKDNKRSTIQKFFNIKIYGDTLISKSTEQWILASKIAIFLMAVSEAISWAYFGSQFGNDNWWILTAAFMGGSVFLIIWLIDSTFMTLDRYKRYYHEKTYIVDVEADKESKNILKEIWKNNETKFSVMTRVFIIGVSMYFTAGYLTDLFFHSEIKYATEKYTDEAISNGRKSIVLKYSIQDSVLSQELNQLNVDYTTEVAGKGESKRYGLGDAALTIKERITAKSDEIEKNKTEEQEELTRYDNFAKLNDYESLGQIWGVDVPELNSELKSKIKEPILESKEGKRAEYAIKGFLGFIFLSLMLLKVLEPRGVRIYLSDALQQHFQTYLEGGFNNLIRNPLERSKNAESQMQPFRFEEFMLTDYHDYINNLHNDENRLKVEAMLVQIEDRINQIEEDKSNLYTEVKNELDQLNSNVKAIHETIDKCNEEIGYINDKIEKVKFDLDIVNTEINNIHSFIENSPSGSVGRKAVEGHFKELERLQNEKKAFRNTLSEYKAREVELKNTIQREEKDRKSFIARLDIIQGPMKELDTRIKSWKKRKFDLIEERLNKTIDKVRESDV